MQCRFGATALPAMAAAMVIFAACASGAAQTDAQPLFPQAHEQFLKANAGDEAAIGEAVARFGELAKAEPSDPVVLVYLGAAIAMQARTTWLPWKKISYAEDGMALQDKAITLLGPKHDAQLSTGVPASIVVRFTAASTFLAVPGFFNRGEQGARLLREVLASAQFDSSPALYKATVWMRAAKLAIDRKHPDEARRYLESVAGSGTPLAEAAKTQLSGL